MFLHLGNTNAKISLTIDVLWSCGVKLLEVFIRYKEFLFFLMFLLFQAFCLQCFCLCWKRKLSLFHTSSCLWVSLLNYQLKY